MSFAGCLLLVNVTNTADLDVTDQFKNSFNHGCITEECSVGGRALFVSIKDAQRY